MWVCRLAPITRIGTMRKFLLIASVAAIAVTAPAQAERGGHKGEPAEAQAHASEGGGKQRAERAERTQVKAKGRSEAPGQARAQRPFETRQTRPQFERRARTQEARS